MVCVKCSQPTNPQETVKCVVCSCEFHPACCRVRTAAKLNAMNASGVAWRCENCPAETNDGDDASIIGILKSIQKQIDDNKKETAENFTNLQATLSSINSTLAGLQLKIATVEQDNKNLKMSNQKLEQANAHLTNQLKDLEWKTMELERYTRRWNIEIRGIPTTVGENVYLVVNAVAKALDLKHHKHEDISISHRLPGPRNSKWPPAILVKFVRRETRLEWLAAARVRRIVATDVQPTFGATPVLVNEHLIKYDKDLLSRAKSSVRTGELSHAWVRDGKIFVRKTADSRARRIFYWPTDETPVTDAPPHPHPAAPAASLIPATATKQPEPPLH